ncbi:unnamed protein product [Parajaminaea phylloscopi]
MSSPSPTSQPQPQPQPVTGNHSLEDKKPFDCGFQPDTPHTSHVQATPDWLSRLPPGPKQTPTQSIRKKSKSVRSLTREYESSDLDRKVSSSDLSKKSSASELSRKASNSELGRGLPERQLANRPSNPSLRAGDDPFDSIPNQPPSRRSASPAPTSPPSLLVSHSEARETGAASLHSSDRGQAHSRRPSAVLLASGSYPSTLNLQSHREPRPRTSATSSPTHTTEAAPSVRLATAAYPSTYTIRKKSSDISLSSPLSPRDLNRANPSPTSGSADAKESGPALGRMAETQGSQGSQHSPQPHLSGSHRESEDPHSSFDDENDAVGDLLPVDSSSSRRNLAQMSPAERREHSRKHSRVHSRNLSVFFPQPGSEAEREQDQHRVVQGLQMAGQPSALGETPTRPHIVLDSSHATIGHLSGLQPPSASDEGSALSPSPTKSRRGHHSKHSVSHNLHSHSARTHHDMLRDPSADSLYSSEVGALTSVGLNRTSSSASHSASIHSHSHGNDHHHDHHHHAPHHHHAHSAQPATGSFIASIPAPPPALLPPMLYSLAHFLLGSSLWVSGQANDLVSVTGLGYLVVFDSLGCLNEVLAQWISHNKRSADGKVDRLGTSYSSHRVSTLLNFVQTIYLLFSAVYVCKESIEHVLLEGPAAEVTAAPASDVSATPNVPTSGHHHHGEASTSGAGPQLPTALLLLATLACLFANLFMSNHARLVAASGLSTTATPSRPARRHSRTHSVLVSTTHVTGPLLSLLSNPFSLAVLFFAATLLFSALTMSSVQVVALDKVLAGLEAVAMWYVALPASKVLGKILLQTSPSITSEEDGGRAQTVQLLRAAKALEDNPLIAHVARPHIWQLTPSTSGVASQSQTSLALSPSSLPPASKKARSPALVAMVQVSLYSHASDEDVLKVTKWAYARLAPSIAAGMGVPAGEILRGSVSAGELTVQVKREGEEYTVNGGGHGHDHHGHDHHRHGHHSHDHHGHDHHGHDHHGHDHHGHDHHSHDHHGHGHDHHSHDHHGHDHHGHGHAEHSKHIHPAQQHEHGQSHAHTHPHTSSVIHNHAHSAATQQTTPHHHHHHH